MALKDRYQNPVIGDTVKLRLFVFNSNNTATLEEVDKIEIYYLDPDARTPSNPDGRTLVQTFPGSDATQISQGEYELDVNLTQPPYPIGHYIDKWYVHFATGDPQTSLEHLFQVFPDLWYTTPIPIIYDFSFYFQPNKFRKGERKTINIEIIPNVPRGTDLEQYYLNLAIVADLKVSIAQQCGECTPCEADARLIADEQPATYRERNMAAYFLDTTELDCGIYDIWFRMDFGGNTYISPKNQIQIY